MRQFGIDDKAKALEIGQRFFDAGYIAPFEAKDRSQSMLQEGVVYFWSEVVVMERKYLILLILTRFLKKKQKTE